MAKAGKTVFADVVSLAWPAMLENALQTIVQYADTAMVGSLGAMATGAVGLTTPVGWLVSSPMSAAGIGVLSCIARSLGAGDDKTARKALIQALYMVIVIGSVLGLITVGISGSLPVWMGGAPELIDTAGRYFRIISLPMVFRASSIIFASSLRASGDTRTPMRISFGMNILNILLNFFLIFEGCTVRVWGLELFLPRAGMGVIGAAVATAISYTLGGMLMFAFAWRAKKISPRGMKLKIDGSVMRDCVRVAVPVGLSRIGSGFGYVVFLSQVSSLGTIPLAAHALAITAEEAVYLPGFGVSAAASTLAGNAIGARDEKRLRQVSAMTTLFAVGLMTLTGAIMFLIPDKMLSIFTPDQEVIRLGAGLLRLIAVTEPVYAVGIIMGGIFNGVGDTRVPFIISMATMWGIRITFTAIVVHVLHGTLTQVWICMAADNVVRAALLTVHFFRGKWIKNAMMKRG